MDVKGAIEKVKDKYEGWMGYARTQREVDELRKERDKIIRLLKRGEKYKKIAKKIKEYAFEFPRIRECVGLRNIIGDLEQKYFPKPSKNFTEEVMEKINKKGEV